MFLETDETNEKYAASFFEDMDISDVEAAYNRVLPAGVVVAMLTAATFGFATYKFSNPNGSVDEQKRPVLTLTHTIEQHIAALPGEKIFDEAEVKGLKLTTRLALIAKPENAEEEKAEIARYKARIATVFDIHNVDRTSGKASDLIANLPGAVVQFKIMQRRDKKNPDVVYKEADLFTKGGVTFLEHRSIV